MHRLIQKSLGHIDWNKSAVQLQSDSRMRVLASCPMWLSRQNIEDMEGTRYLTVQSTTPAGTVVQIKPYPVVSTGNGCLELLEIQLAG